MIKVLRNQKFIVSILFLSLISRLLIRYINRILEYPIILQYISMTLSTVISIIMISYIILFFKDWKLKNEIKRNKEN